MISITCMLIISTLQSSIDKMVPKTSYLKMVDIFLIYSFNIVIVIMAVHTYMDFCIHRDEVTGIIVNTSSRPSSKSTVITPQLEIILTVGVTKVQPLVQDPGQEETQSLSSSRVSSAKSLVSSMFSGSEEDTIEYDAYARARKINLYGQVWRGIRRTTPSSPSIRLASWRSSFSS